MKALVTGGAGFIGSHLADALVERGDEVTIVDDLSTGKRENLEGRAGSADLVEADIRDARAMKDLIDRVRPSVVFHLAAQSTSASPPPTPPGTRRSTCSARSTCSRPRSRPAWSAS